MKVTAHLQNSEGQHEVTLRTDGHTHSLTIPPKETGFGSSASGAELLFLALATCYCNDIYREAEREGFIVDEIEVEVTGEFGAAGEPARNITYSAKVSAQATEAEIRDLMRHTDKVAEIQNTLRKGLPVTLGKIEVVSV